MASPSSSLSSVTGNLYSLVLLLLASFNFEACYSNCVTDPCVAPKAYDCPMRMMALEYANVTLGASANLGPVHDALNLTVCGNTFQQASTSRRQVYKSSGNEIFVATTGDDQSGDGSMAKPFATVHRAQTAARGMSSPTTVSIRAGTYYLAQTLSLSQADSGSTYQAYQNEIVKLSGGKLLTGLSWKPRSAPVETPPSPINTTSSSSSPANPTSTLTSSCSLHIYNDTACTRNPYNTLKQATSVGECCTKCSNDVECGGFTYHQGETSYCLFSHVDGTGWPTPEKGITCGTKTPISPTPPPSPPSPSSKVFVAQLPAGTNVTVANIDELFFGETRQWPARYPNGNPALPRDGYCGDGKASFENDEQGAVAAPMNVEIYCHDNVTAKQLVGGGTMVPFNQNFNFSVPCSTIPPSSDLRDPYGPLYAPPMYMGGALKRFEPPHSYWNSTVPNILTGVERASTWSDPQNWRVHAYHPLDWGNWGFQVDSYADDTIHFSNGGNQEARGGHGMGDKYFSGMLEELDNANEFFYSRSTNEIYWAPAGDAPSSTTEIVIPVLARLIEVVGAGNSGASIATDITISGLILQHTAPTFCCEFPYESVSGGDWSIHRGGMVFMENATDSQVADCILDSPGGNGIFLSGYTQGLHIHHNEIKNAGDSLIAVVGITSWTDGRELSYPTNNTFDYNHLHDWGVWGKQTSAFFAGMSRDQAFDHNIVYNGPRAGINQNDGFAGGNVISYNLVFNTVLDTGDHGNFNSWDRKPWIWLQDQTDETSISMVPNRHHINNNFIIRTSFLGKSANLYCIDHDDGSSMYHDFDNYLVYGGIKFREGLSKHASNNYLTYPNGPDNRMVPFADQCKGSNNTYLNNTVITGTGQFYGSCAAYNPAQPLDHATIDYNTFYSPTAEFSDGGCAGKGDLGWKAWQTAGLGQDTHSTLQPDTASRSIYRITLSNAISVILPHRPCSYCFVSRWFVFLGHHIHSYARRWSCARVPLKVNTRRQKINNTCTHVPLQYKHLLYKNKEMLSTRYGNTLARIRVDYPYDITRSTFDGNQ